MKRMTFIAGGFARFPKAHGKSSDQCELTPEEIQQIRTMSASSEPVFTSAKRWPAIDKLVAKINRHVLITRSFVDDSVTVGAGYPGNASRSALTACDIITLPARR